MAYFPDPIEPYREGFPFFHCNLCGKVMQETKMELVTIYHYDDWSNMTEEEVEMEVFDGDKSSELCIKHMEEEHKEGKK